MRHPALAAFAQRAGLDEATLADLDASLAHIVDDAARRVGLDDTSDPRRSELLEVLRSSLGIGATGEACDDPAPSVAFDEAATHAESDGLGLELTGAGATIAARPSAIAEDDETEARDISSPPTRRPALSSEVAALLAAPSRDASGSGLPARYEDLGALGKGGMGEVRRVRDRVLGRTLALKVISPHLVRDDRAMARFVEEAQVSAQLEHPGIIPVHELGQLRDGRYFFTMREIKGQNLSRILRAARRWEPAPPDDDPRWSLRRLIDVFKRLCEAVGYAHTRSVIHRDLKPSNLMVGDNGEVLVVDWGLVKVTKGGRGEEESDAPIKHGIRNDILMTQVGVVTGTPAYMSPEQARGLSTRLDPRSDVYALGAILYQILSGRRPYQGADPQSVLAQVARDEPLPLETICAQPVPEALIEICRHAMTRDLDARMRDARVLAQALGDWLDGVQRRDRAMALVEESRALEATAETLETRAEALRARGAARLQAVESWAPEEKKRSGWALEDEGARLEREATRRRNEAEERLHAALSHAPELISAHVALCARFTQAHRLAETRRDDATVARLAHRLQAHARALPEGDETRRETLGYLLGIGALTLVTDPPGASARLFRYVEHHRRLVPEFVRDLGETPIIEAPIECGDYLVELRHERRALVRYPVSISRLEHWRGVRPGDGESSPIPLPAEGRLGPDEVYVPGGWFWAGGDSQAFQPFDRRRYWVDPFVMQRFPVTNREFIEFLDDLVAHQREDDAMRFVPHERSGSTDTSRTMIYGFDGARFSLRPDNEGDLWLPDWPVVVINWFTALAFARWRAERTGMPWRLPEELEWEKAARGVDGRFFPWGDRFDSSWCVMRDSLPAKDMLPMNVDGAPVDESPYGVQGLAGNVREWCATAKGPQPPSGVVQIATVEHSDVHEHTSRGGSWRSYPRYCRAATRRMVSRNFLNYELGVRLIRSTTTRDFTPIEERDS